MLRDLLELAQRLNLGLQVHHFVVKDLLALKQVVVEHLLLNEHVRLAVGEEEQSRNREGDLLDRLDHFDLDQLLHNELEQDGADFDWTVLQVVLFVLQDWLRLLRAYLHLDELSGFGLRSELDGDLRGELQVVKHRLHLRELEGLLFELLGDGRVSFEAA